MKSKELGIKSNSNYYIHSPSLQAKKTFFYPLFVGHFEYEKGYALSRNSFDSFLIMHIKKGSLTIKIDNNTFIGTDNQIIFIDCYKPHSYYANTDSIVDWLHFDGVTAKEYFSLITKDSNYVFTLSDTFTFTHNFNKIYSAFNENKPIKEILQSKYITNILTELAVQQDTSSNNITTSSIEETISYINDNITEELSLEFLSERVSLSPYYFTRVFKKETGFTPHQYVLYTRINHAKFLLKNTDLSIKEICFICGFSVESNFCTSFKKWTNVTPSNYRLNKSN